MFNFFNTATNAVTSLTLAVGNPFDVVKQIFTDYADPIKNMLYAGAICALVVCWLLCSAYATRRSEVPNYYPSFRNC